MGNEDEPVRGRPCEYDPSYCERLIEFMGQGGSVEEFAGSLKHSKQTIYDWLKKFPDFLDAKRRGEAASLHWWGSMSRQHLVSVSESYGGNTGSKSTSLNAAVYRLNMANRFGWKDRIEHTGEVDMHGTRAKVNKLMKDPKTAEAARAVALALSEPEDKDDLPSGE